MQIQAGKYYRRRDGRICGPAKLAETSNTYRWNLGGNLFADDGRWSSYRKDLDLIAEVTVTDVLPFELKAGEKYETVKPDGTAGEVLTLGPARGTPGEKRIIPFTAYTAGDSDRSWHVTQDGSCVRYYDMVDDLRITAPYIAPPPTITERLEKAIELLANPRQDDSAFALIRGCIAELKNTESRPKDSTAG
jgi:hypothetical protein